MLFQERKIKNKRRKQQCIAMQKLVKRSTAGCPQSDLQHELHVAGRDQMPVELTASCSNLSYKQKKGEGCL